MNSRYVNTFIAMLLGIVAAYTLGAANAAVISTIAVIIFILAGFLLKKDVLFLSMLFVVFLIGTALFYFENIVPKELDGEYVTVSGRICELPISYDNEINYYIVKPKELTYRGKAYKINKYIRISTESEYKYGDCIKASGFLAQFRENMNDNSFNARLHYKSLGVAFKLHAQSSELSPTQYRSYTPHSIMLYIQSFCSDYIDANYDGIARAYLRAFMTGKLDGFTIDDADVLVRSGARRFLYAPSVHTAIILAILGAVFFVFNTGKNSRDTITAIILVLYAAMCGERAIFLKALLMYAFVIMYKKKFGYLYKLDAVAVCGFIILLFNPMLAFDVGFIVTVTFSTLYLTFSKPIASWLKFLGRFKYPVAMWIIGFIGLMPIYSYFFSGTPFYTVLIAAVAFPLSVIIITLFWISMAFHLLFGTTVIADFMLAPMLYGYDLWARLVDFLPFSYIVFPAPSITAATLFYSVILFLAYMLRKRKSESIKLFMLSFITGMSIFTVCGLIGDIGGVKVMFVNVGQGDGAAVSVNYGEKLLIDGGGSEVYSSYSIGRYVYVPFLKSVGVNKADAIVTHYHKDHCEGIIEAVKQLKIRTLYMPDTDEDNAYRHLLIQAARQNDTEIAFVKGGDTISYKSGLTVEFISPDSEDIDTASDNASSLVAYVNYGDFSVLFTGDTESEQEMKMLDKGLIHECDVLKSAHHGSLTSNTEEFISAVNPEYTVISVGESNRYNLPNDDVLDRLENSKILRTDENGTVIFHADKSGVKKISITRNGK